MEMPFGRILLVDDNPEFLKVTDHLLNLNGFGVLAATDASAALEAIGSDENVDVLLADVLMPEVDGIALARQARALRPTLKIGLMSIMSPKNLEHYWGKDIGDFSFIMKPWPMRALVDFLQNDLR